MRRCDVGVLVEQVDRLVLVGKKSCYGDLDKKLGHEWVELWGHGNPRMEIYRRIERKKAVPKAPEPDAEPGVF